MFFIGWCTSPVWELSDEYLLRVEEAQNCDGQLSEEDQCEAEGELEGSNETHQ